MLDCGKIIADILYDCNKPPKGGIEQGIVLINRSDIDKALTVVDSDVATGKHSITSLVLKTGATGYLIEGIQSKQIFMAGYTINVADDQPDDFTHTINVRLFNCNEQSSSIVNNLAVGADLVAVARHKNGCIEVYGFDGGLKVSEGARSSSENRGSTTLTLSSVGVDTESKTPYIYNAGDDATNLANFNAKFSA